MSDPVLLEEKDGIAEIRLNDPDRRNPMTPGMARAFEAVVADLRERKGLRAVVITGEGKAFSAGGDLTFLDDRRRATPKENHDAMLWFYQRWLCIRTLPVPVVGAINGHAIGAGLSFILAADYRVCSDTAKLGFTFTRLGIHPGMATTFYLPKRVGQARASVLVASGEVFGAEEAMQWGLVDETIAAEAVVSQARVVAARMTAGGPHATAMALETLRHREDQGLAEAMEREAWCQAACYASEEYAEGLKALQEKREPVF